MPALWSGDFIDVKRWKCTPIHSNLLLSRPLLLFKVKVSVHTLVLISFDSLPLEYAIKTNDIKF